MQAILEPQIIVRVVAEPAQPALTPVMPRADNSDWQRPTAVRCGLPKIGQNCLTFVWAAWYPLLVV